MKLERLKRVPLKARLIGSYLVILAVGGLATSLVGSWIVSSTIMREAQSRSGRDLAMAGMIYQERLDQLAHAVELLASESATTAALREARPGLMQDRLEAVRARSGFDFLGLANREGGVLARALASLPIGDTLPSVSVVRAALAGRPAAATEVVGADDLAREGVSAPEAEAIAMVVGAPVAGEAGVLGILYGGKLLDRNSVLVDRMWGVLYRGEYHDGRPVGAVSIVRGSTRVATTVRTDGGARAEGTTIADEVEEGILGAERPWSGRAPILSELHLSSYEPLRDLDGAVVGALEVGILERYHAQIIFRVIASFFTIAGIGFLMILLITYAIIGTTLAPIHEMAEAAQQIAAGDFEQRVRARGDGEIGVLAESFNTMTASLRQMREDLESWGRTLEEKVRERTQELVEMQTRMARTERLASLGMLSAGVAHEINNPLGGVLALTALTLEDLSAEDPSRPNLEEVVRQAERCKKIVKGLLEFSRQSAGSGEPVDLSRAVDDALALVGSQAAFFNIELSKDYERDLPPVMCDRSELQQVLLNIIVNGAQAMDERGRMTVTTRRAGMLAEVSITDTGRGIPPDQIDRIFDPFFTTKPEGHGTGLGLSIAYGIVSKHGGTISVASEVGHGSSFTVRLPIAPSFADDPQRAAEEISAYP